MMLNKLLVLLGLKEKSAKIVHEAEYEISSPGDIESIVTMITFSCGRACCAAVPELSLPTKVKVYAVDNGSLVNIEISEV